MHSGYTWKSGKKAHSFTTTTAGHPSFLVLRILRHLLRT